MTEPADDSKFFEHGEVSLDMCDPRTRTASVKICMPCCLFQTISPHLLGGGMADDLRIRSPLAFWTPTLGPSRISPHVRSPGAEAKVNVAVRAAVESVGRLFVNLQDALVDPADVIPMLPLGTYVSFTYRFRVDDSLKILEGIGSVNVVGAPEFQAAMAAVLTGVLLIFERVAGALPAHI